MDIPRTQNKEFYIDKDDYRLIKEQSWREAAYGYVETNNWMSERPHEIKMHRFILDVNDSNVIVDHINQNKMDNRKCNLRISDKQTNGINRGANKNNKIGLKGVSQVGKRYTATMTIDGKRLYLGLYKTPEEAYKVRMQREKELFGEFSNSQYKEE